MTSLKLSLAILVVACSSSPAPAPRAPEVAAPPPVSEPSPPASAVAPKQVAPERLAADTARTTAAGNTFVAPAGWSVIDRGRVTVLESPEGDSWIALIDVEARTADAAVAEAWAAYKPGMSLPLIAATQSPDKDGWQDRRTYSYQTSPNERRLTSAAAMRHGEQWTVWIADMAQATAGKRTAATALIFGRLLPKGYVRETFAGRRANQLDAARIGELTAFIERAQRELGVPGVSIGIIQDRKTVFAGGFGVRELGKPAAVDADTLYLIASNTKAMTTLMLGKLVDEHKLAWDTPVTTVMPQFKLGDADTTGRVQVKHLICACTGLPRRDYEWLLEFEAATPARALAMLGTMKPTSGFGEMYQYSNPLAAAGGYVGGYVLFPRRELGAAYDEAMRTRVFGPLGMTATTFDFKRAQRGNHAVGHGTSIDDKPERALMELNSSVIAVRPAGGAWSSVNDMLKYVAMELAGGVLPNGKRYISEAALLERRAPQVAIGKDASYGMGLQTDSTYGVPVVHHGGSLIGYKSDMLWLPDHGIGAVVLTNGDAGLVLYARFQRKLLEVLFDGKPEADNDLAANVAARHVSIAASRKLLTVPAERAEVDKLAAKYAHPTLGGLRVIREGDATVFDFGEWKSPVASMKNPDGTVSFVTTITGLSGLPLVVGSAGGKRTLTVRDAQHEYTFTEL